MLSVSITKRKQQTSQQVINNVTTYPSNKTTSAKNKILRKINSDNNSYCHYNHKQDLMQFGLDTSLLTITALYSFQTFESFFTYI